MAERRLDQSPTPKRGKETGAPRALLRRYMSSIRGERWAPDQKAGRGLAIWPRANDPQLRLWLDRTAGRRIHETFVAERVEAMPGPSGEMILRFRPSGTRVSEIGSQ